MNRVLRSFAAIVCIAAASMASTASAAWHDGIATARAARDWVFGWVAQAVQVFKPPKDWRSIDLPAVAFVSARAFVLRLAKRSRPITTPGWRMCPST